MTVIQFEFIDGTKTDRMTRRLARSHAMKGKNVGKKHNRRSRVAAVALSSASQYQTSDLQHEISPTESALSEDDRQTGQCSQGRGPIVAAHPDHHLYLLSAADLPLNDLLPFHFPIDATPQSQHVIKQFFADVTDVMYPVQLCHSLDKINSRLLNVLFMDQTSYHCSVALMATFNHFVFGRELPSVAATHHLTQAVALVNQALDTPRALSNSNLSVVNFMVVLELLRGARPEVEIHLKGLEKMIQLRGGILELRHDSMLMLKICKTDLDVALHFGTQPYFYRDQMPQVLSHLAVSGFVLTPEVATFDPAFKDLSPALYQIILDVANLALFFNQGYRIDPLVLQEAITSLGYRLLRFQPMDPAFSRTKLEAVCHIALTALTTTLFLHIGRRRFLQYDLVGRRLRDIVTTGMDGIDPDTVLWLLFIGGISVARDDDEAWLFAEIQDNARAGSIENWPDLHQRLRRFPWIRSLHDVDAERLWYSSLRLGTSHPGLTEA